MKKSLYLPILFTLLSALTVFAQSETEKGVELYRDGDFEGAIKVLENVVKTNGKDRKAWTYLGASFVNEKKNNEALNSFIKAEEISLKNLSEKELIDYDDGLRIISKPRANYTDLARGKNTEGKVKVAVEFNKNGEAKWIFTIQALPNGLTEETIAAIRKIKFEPAQKDGKPVSVIKILIYGFTLY
jgi:TonB family protein